MTWFSASALLVAAAFTVKMADGFPSRVPAEAMRLIRFERSQNLVGVKEFMDTEKPSGQYFVYGDATQPTHIALWGDSHAHAIAGVLHRIGLERHTSIRFYGKPATAPILGFNQWNSAKTEYTKNVFEALEADPDISCVILSCFWSAYIKATPLSELDKNTIQSQLQATVARLRKAGKKVIVVYPTPQTDFSVPKRLALNASKRKSINPTQLPDASEFFARNEVILQAFDDLPSGTDLIRIKPHERMIQDHKILLQTPNGDPYYFDSHHITQEAADHLRPVFEIIFTANE